MNTRGRPPSNRRRPLNRGGGAVDGSTGREVEPASSVVALAHVWDDGTELVHVHRVARHLLETLETVLPRPVGLRVDPSLCVRVEPAVFEVLLMSLVLAGRDRGPTGPMCLVFELEGDELCVGLEGDGAPIPSTTSVEVAALAEHLGGAPDHDRPLAVRLPLHRPSLVAVDCRDQFMRLTLSAEIRREGAVPVELQPGQAPPPGVTLVLADQERVTARREGGWRTIAVWTGRLPAPSGPSVRVPFVAGALGAVLRG